MLFLIVINTLCLSVCVLPTNQLKMFVVVVYHRRERIFSLSLWIRSKWCPFSSNVFCCCCCWSWSTCFSFFGIEKSGKIFGSENSLRMMFYTLRLKQSKKKLSQFDPSGFDDHDFCCLLSNNDWWLVKDVFFIHVLVYYLWGWWLERGEDDNVVVSRFFPSWNCRPVNQ